MTTDPTPSHSTPERKKSGFGRIALFGCGGLVVVLIVMMIIYALLPEETKREIEAEQAEEARREHVQDSLDRLRKIAEASAQAEAEQKAAANTKRTEIGHTREELIAWAQQATPGVKIEKGKKHPQWGENYVGSTDGYVYQFYGDNDRVVSASIAAPFIPGNPMNHGSRSNLAGFASMFGADSLNWIDEATADEKLDAKNEIAKEFRGIRYELAVIPMGETGTFANLTVKLPE